MEPPLFPGRFKYGGLEVGEAKRLKALEDENARLKRLVAAAGAGQPDAAGPPPKKRVRPAARRDAVSLLRERYGVSERRACRVVGFGRSSMRYRPKGRPDEERLRGRLRELAAERKRFGYRRLHVLLGRDGMAVNHKRVERLYRQEGLAVRRRARKRLATAERAPLLLPTGPNEQWSLDFVSDALSWGRRIRLRRW